MMTLKVLFQRENTSISVSGDVILSGSGFFIFSENSYSNRDQTYQPFYGIYKRILE